MHSLGLLTPLMDGEEGRGEGNIAPHLRLEADKRRELALVRAKQVPELDLLPVVGDGQRGAGLEVGGDEAGGAARDEVGA